MKEFLKKIKLIENFTIEIEFKKNDFVSKLKEHVDEGSIGLFANAFDVFSSSKNEYKGHVSYDEFKIKRRKRFFDMNKNLAIARGSYKQKNETLIIETEINGFNRIMIPYFLFTIVFYLIFIGVIIMTDSFKGIEVGFVFLFLFIHATFMFGIPYFLMRRSTKRMKYELERDFYYLTKK